MLRAQVIEVEALGTEAHADHPRLRGAEGGGGADVRGPLDEDDVPGIDEHARHEVEALLAALRHQHLAGRGHDPLGRRVLTDGGEERRQPARQDVLEGRRAFAGEDRPR